jgi:hypothetical protein
MGTSLTGLTPSTTYDALIKVGDNEPLSGTAKVLSDGLGNDSILSLSTSRIGIGSTIDSGELITAYGAAEAAIVFQNTNSGTGSGQGLYLGTLNAENYLWTYEDQPLIFGANNDERMRITSTGNVGIGTSSPQGKLSVSSGAAGGGYNSDYDELVLTNAGRVGINILSSATEFGAIIMGGKADNTTGGIYHNALTNMLSLATQDAFRLNIDNAGNVGIGTSSPLAKLQSTTAGSAANEVGLRLNNPNGNVAPTGVDIVFQSGYTTGIDGASVIRGGRNSAATDSYISFETNTGSALTEKLRITPSGNVGIGTSAPSEPLVVSSLLRDYTSAQFSTLLQSTTPQSAGRGGSLGLAGETGGGITAFGGIIGAKENSVFAETGGYLAFTTRANGGSLTEKVRILSSGGITFNGDTAAANALDDYEEGTFTFTAVPATSGTISLSTSSARYTKIGRQVFVQAFITVSSVSSPIGTAILLQGLPFTIANATNAGGSALVVWADASASYVKTGLPGFYIDNTQIYAPIDASSVEASDEFFITMTYTV